MTVSSSTRRAGPFNGNGVTVAFPFTFKVFATTDVAVYLTDANGVQTLLSSNYSITLNGDQDVSPGGTINYPTAGAALPAGYALDVVGDVAYTQGTDLTNLGRFQPNVIERALDKMTILVQQVLEKLARAISFPVGDTKNVTLPGAALRANKALVFDADGGATVSADDYDDQLANVTAQASAAAASAGAAAASEDAAAASVAAAAYIYPGTYAEDPATRPDGSAVQAGDYYFNVTANLHKRYNGATWVASDINTANLAASGGSALVGFIQAGAGAVARMMQAWVRERPVSVKGFGAVGDGVTNDTAAIQAAIAACCTVADSPMRTLHFPPGVYMVDSGVLNLPFFVKGGRITGDGWYASVLRFRELGAPGWMFDNGAAERAQFLVFENLGFEGTTPDNYSAGTIPANAGFIRQWSGAQTQGFKFLNCRIGGFDRVMLCEGTNTASENKFINSKIHHVQAYVLAVNNQQSLNHEFVATDIEVILGDVFQVMAGNGGAIKVFGGSIIPSGTGACAVVRLAGSLVSHGVMMYGARIELRNASVLAVLPNSKLGKVTLSECSIYNTEAAGSRDIVSVGNFGAVHFRGCEFPTNGATSTYRFTATGQFGESGRITWNDCQVPSSLCEDINFDSVYGRASAVACHPQDYGAVAAEPFIKAIDFDLGGSGSHSIAGYRDACVRTKRVWLKAANTIWPKSNGAGGSVNDLTVMLPKNAVIKAIVARKSASGASTGSYTLQVTNSDKSVAYAFSNTDQQKNAHSITVNDLYASVGDTTNGRTIRVSVTGDTTGQENNSAGFGFIEYI